MLHKLVIQNYAIIDQLEIDFSRRLNVITGETGAGKSIIVGALGLILGERADLTALVNKEKKCIVEGTFEVAGKKSIKKFLAEHDFDSNDELVVRREIAPNGKSRAFISDTPVTLSLLNELSRLLVDLHQQFDTMAVGESGFQREVLDALAGHGPVIEEYQRQFNQWKRIKNEVEELKTRKQQFGREADYNRFQFAELEEAGFKEDELETIDIELKMLNNSEGIKAALTKAYFDLKGSDTPLIQQLKIILNELHPYVAFHSDLPALLQRFQSVQIELQDIAGDLDHVSAHINYDPEKIDQLNERLSLGYRMQKKHSVNSTRALLEIRDRLEEKLQAVLDIDEAIRQQEKVVEETGHTLSLLAAKIAAGRHKQIKPFEDNVNKLLVKVGMPNARLKVDIQPAELNVYGSDDIDFLFDANLPAGQSGKSGQFQPVRKVASGGELSRLMLCIKSLVAESVDFPTLIFDEIDTGISGEAARQIGMIMKELAIKRQVICITHQPQIAGQGEAHFFVYKQIANNTVKTNIRQLTKEERIITIAQMLSGEKPTAAALANAREMVMN